MAFSYRKTKKSIEITAHNIIKARELYPESTLVNLYDDLIMPAELRIGLSALYIAIQSYFIYDAIVVQKSPFWAILWFFGIVLVIYDFYDKQIKKHKGKQINNNKK